MRKADQRRKASRKHYLAELSLTNPANFEVEWEKHLSSWLSEIHILAKDWADVGENSKKKLFEILNEAMEILEAAKDRSAKSLHPRHTASSAMSAVKKYPALLIIAFIDSLKWIS